MRVSPALPGDSTGIGCKFSLVFFSLLKGSILNAIDLDMSANLTEQERRLEGQEFKQHVHSCFRGGSS